MGTPPAALGATTTSTPMNPSGDTLSTDGFYQSILQAAQGGNNTGSYFDQVNAFSQFYSQMNDQGFNAWTTGKDDQGNPVYFMEESAGTGTYYIKVALEGLKTDNDQNMVSNGTQWIINGVTYYGYATVTKTIGFNNFPFAKISRDIGLAVAGLAPLKAWGTAIWNGIKTVAQTIVDAIKGFFGGGGAAGGEELQEKEIETDATAEKEIQSGGEVAVDETVADGAAVASGTVFIAAVLVIAAIFIALSFILHNTYHNLRIWNLTKYDIDWAIYIDQDPFQEGQLAAAPLDFKTNLPTPIMGASVDTHIPNVHGPPQVHYADFSLVSSHEFNGIGYALQLSLNDPQTKQTAYTVTVYYDLPFNGDNSTNLTFDAVSDLGQWYKANEGNNQETLATASSSDNMITASSTYDFLNGQHAVPTQLASSSNEAYFYQSVLVIAEPTLKVSDLS